jgi:adenine-specific DNA-methyltransferase
MARRSTKQAGSIRVEAITHANKRPNLPVSGEDAREFVTEEMQQPIPVRYPRDSTLDPQLVWRGKEELDGEDLTVDAPPIYIQEKIDPRVIIENLRRTVNRNPNVQEPTLFGDFDGLPELDLVEFYCHQVNWSNRMILGDSLNVMASLAEREGLRGHVQMIYMDPPYGIKFGSNWQISARSREVRDGRMEDATREVEQIKAFRDTWELGIHSYLTYLRDRLAVASDLLTDSGSIFVQIGDENVHLVRSLMDEVFGSENFVNLVPFQKTAGAGSPSGTTDVLPRVVDYLVWYAKAKEKIKYRELLLPKGVDTFIPTAYARAEESDGIRRPATLGEKEGNLATGVRLYALDNLTSASGVDKTRYPVTFAGRTFSPGEGVWKTSRQGMDRLISANRIEATAARIGYVRYLDDFPAVKLPNVWTDTVSSFMADKLYVVQTNTKIVERCLLMTTDPGDLVVDPTCGSGTTALVAEQWGRRWITTDTSRVALALARQRLVSARYAYYLLADSADGHAKEAALAGAPPPPTQPEFRKDIRHGFVYERIQHITLKSIANNPDIEQGLDREHIYAAIRRHAESALLYDKPYKDVRKVRVSGPFTVETLSPHRATPLGREAGTPPVSRGADSQVVHGDDSVFEETIRENLTASGIQNGKRSERLTFDTLVRYAASHIQFVGEREQPTDGGPRRVGITIGPQYGTVGPSFIKDAAREAIRADDLDLLCILAFAFDPSVLGTGDGYVTSDEGFAEVTAERRMGRVPVLLVRMNADLVMGKDLKSAPNANLFTVFGEPDIELVREDGKFRAILRGVDVYDPNSGELRDRSTDRIALWMIDTDYNGESFFVRHCYFTGGNDPYAKLRRALRAEIDESAWEALYRTESLPFPPPATGRIAVKVINDYGDEVVKVIAV